VPVRLAAHLTEIGTLEIHAESKISENRWRLQFELRKPVLAENAKKTRPVAVVSQESVTLAAELVRDVFSRGNLAPEELPSKLEQTLALGRNSWPLETIRKLADIFLELSEGRRISAQHESRWLNLTSLCLRPGFGFPGDDFRIEQARRVFAQGLTFGRNIDSEIQWWIFWGRVAGGLNRNQQADIYQRLSVTLLPRGKAPRVNESLLREMWRCAASLELLPIGTKTELGGALVRSIRNSGAGRASCGAWDASGRGRLFYGPINQVVPATSVVRWVDGLAKIAAAGEPLARLAQETGDASRDLPQATVDLVRRTIGDDPRLLRILEGSGEDMEGMARVFGEELPSGLVLSNAE